MTKRLDLGEGFAPPIELMIQKTAVLARTGAGKTNVVAVVTEEVLDQKQQVNVGVREKLAPPIAADSEQSQSLLVDRREMEFPRLTHSIVDRHTYAYRGFYVDTTEVTNGAWAEAMAKHGLSAPGAWRDGKLDEKRRDHPVTGVTFAEAERLVCRLGDDAALLP